MAWITKPDWKANPDAKYFFPENKNCWAAHYKIEDGKLYRKLQRDREWSFVPSDEEAHARFTERLLNGLLIRNPELEGENSWLDSPA